MICKIHNGVIEYFQVFKIKEKQKESINDIFTSLFGALLQSGLMLPSQAIPLMKDLDLLSDSSYCEPKSSLFDSIMVCFPHRLCELFLGGLLGLYSTIVQKF